jgi:MazG family protein
METRETRIITPDELGATLDVLAGQRFVLGLCGVELSTNLEGCVSCRILPTDTDSYLLPQTALGIMTWGRFAEQHYGCLVCVATLPVARVLRELLGAVTRIAELSEAVLDGDSGSSSIVQEAHDLAVSLAPLVGTQYTAIEEFRLLVAELREKCPWDRRQTHLSLLDTLLEESYEVALAIEESSLSSLEEELGDLFLQVFIQSEIAREEGAFDICSVIRHIDDKLTFRHPHVFGDFQADSSEKVLDNWQRLKDAEGRRRRYVDSAKLLSSIENALLAQETARDDGFDFESVDQAYGKLLEESRELGDELTAVPLDTERLSMELGDVLFASLNVARLAGINPVKALRHSFHKFGERYERVRAFAVESHVDIAAATPEELETLWQRAKNT